MRNSILFSILLCCAFFQISIAQTKKPITKVPVKKTTTTKTVVKKPAVIVKPAPVIVVAPTTVEPTPAPATVVVQEPTGPPNTGKVIEGPKSYSSGQPSTTLKSTTKTATKTTKIKTSAVEKVEKPKVQKMHSAESTRSYIGIRGGYNLSTIQDVLKLTVSGNTGSAKATNLAGYMGGLVFNFGVSKSFSIQPEVLYAQQGAQITDGDNFIKGKTNVVNVPLLFKLAVGSPQIKFFINAGPYIGYALNSTVDIKLNGTLTTQKLDFNNEYDISGQKDNRIDFGAIGGAGLQFNLGGPLLTLEGRYQFGMADPILYKNGKPAEVGSSGRNRIMTGTLGVLFPFGGK
jgi:Outer membrane protein beta-barrel domain